MRIKFNFNLDVDFELPVEAVWLLMAIAEIALGL